MKNQYLCDINDYRKYGLLRILAKELSICVGWMLTPDDERNDGNSRGYLSKYADRKDPQLFSALKRINSNSDKTVRDIEGEGLIPKARYFADEVPQDRAERARFFNRLTLTASSSSMVFLDPDNGMEVRAYPKGSRNSPKYVYWDEVAQLWAVGKSLLIYQHFPRIKRTIVVPKLMGRARIDCPGSERSMIKAGNVGYLLLLQPKHANAEITLGHEMNRWGDDLSFFGNV